jgi:hypothetical protein
MYFPRNREFESALSKLRNFGGGGLNPSNTPLGTPMRRKVLREGPMSWAVLSKWVLGYKKVKTLYHQYSR